MNSILQELYNDIQDLVTVRNEAIEKKDWDAVLHYEALLEMFLGDFNAELHMKREGL